MKNEINFETLKRNLKGARARKGLSQEQVAKILDVSRQTIVNYEKHPQTLNIDKLNALAIVYGVHPYSFFMD